MSAVAIKFDRVTSISDTTKQAVIKALKSDVSIGMHNVPRSFKKPGSDKVIHEIYYVS